MFTVIKRLEISASHKLVLRIAANAPVYTVTTGLSLSTAVRHN